MNADPVGGLARGRTEVMAALADVPADELSRRQAVGEWSAWEIAYHLFDIERWYVAKLCEAATDDRTAALARFMRVWARLREETIAVAAEIPADRLDDAGLLTGVLDWTPRTLLAAVATHDREHAEQATRARRGAVPTTTGGRAEHT